MRELDARSPTRVRERRPARHRAAQPADDDDALPGGLPYPVAFEPQHPHDTLAAVVACTGARQLHIPETEKYAHVTYFLGGGREQPEPGERRELVASARDFQPTTTSPR